MAANFDLSTINDDLYINPLTGDFTISNSDENHIQDNIISFPGWWKQYPQDGIGIFAYQNSSGQEQELARVIKQQLTLDGYQVNNPLITTSPSGILNVQPNATKP
jgi:hypothetical protein